MFIPVGDTPNPRNYTPWVNWTLIAANITAFALLTVPLSSRGVNLDDPLLQKYIRLIAPSLSSVAQLRHLLAHMSAYDLFVFAHGYKPGAPEFSALWASLFLHAGFWHLAGNMLFLWIYGDNVEHRLGRLGYLLFYLFSGVTATLFFSIFAAGSMTPLIGASGAISGVLGVYFVVFPRNQVKVFVALFPIFFNVILLPARWVLGIFLLIDNVVPFLFNSQSHVAYGAHIGGFLAGLAVAWGGEYFDWYRPWTTQARSFVHRNKARSTVSAEYFQGSPLAVLREALANRQAARAIDALMYINRQEMEQLQARECAVLANWLDEAGDSVTATKILKVCLTQHSASGDVAEVYLALGLIRLKQGQPTAAYQHLLSVFDQHPTPAIAEQARQALARIEGNPRKN
ncbi:hypothetical protein CSB45_08225 [candidate division KSB3 bacterium]|uniref:Peptidase S54 rhomboid domain-containing protein n=1 Tax=candidate division KSB3 bacterium TaxID=2044937 RepID=A0A2G6E565_9BACT|nr:MAG: hypothetical protein CSB45_08225 [candidate division KSB3 bacterium]PIE29794.1 MAG: hypothetical protein CSA57_06990 [candidate division KSB3 bacterium]